MNFVVPEDGLTYTNNTLLRCKSLIAHNIWEGIDETRLLRWMNNFKTAEHRYFATRILDTLMYRSDTQTKSMLKHLFQRTLPDISRHHNLPNELTTALNLLRMSREPNVRVVPVVPSRQQNQIMSSGPLIARIIHKHLRIQKQWILDPGSINDNTPFVIFVDDFIGTGTQFSQFMHRAKLVHLIDNRRCCFVALAGHQIGIKHLRTKFASLPVSAVDLLNTNNSLFDTESSSFLDGTNTIEAAYNCYDQVLSALDMGTSRFRTGFGNLNLAYAFAHGVPNNCTPLLWWSESDNWFPLFDR